MKLDLPANATWRTGALEWARSVRRHLAKHPNIAPLLGERGMIAPSWIEKIGALGEILSEPGLSDQDYGLAMQAIVLVATTLPVAEHFTELVDPASAIYSALGSSAQPHSDALLRMASNMPDAADVFDVAIKGVLDQVDRLARG